MVRWSRPLPTTRPWPKVADTISLLIAVRLAIQVPRAGATASRPKLRGHVKLLKGSYWTTVYGRGHVCVPRVDSSLDMKLSEADGRLVEFQGSGTARSERLRCSVQQLGRCFKAVLKAFFS